MSFDQQLNKSAKFQSPRADHESAEVLPPGTEVRKHENTSDGQCQNFLAVCQPPNYRWYCENNEMTGPHPRRVSERHPSEANDQFFMRAQSYMTIQQHLNETLGDLDAELLGQQEPFRPPLFTGPSYDASTSNGGGHNEDAMKARIRGSFQKVKSQRSMDRHLTQSHQPLFLDSYLHIDDKSLDDAEAQVSVHSDKEDDVQVKSEDELVN